MSDERPHENPEDVSDIYGEERFDLGQALANALRTDPKSISAHLVLLRRDIEIASTKTKLHCYFLPVDANGRIRFKPLAEFLRDEVINYSIPRKTIDEAFRVSEKTRSPAPISRLHETAKGLFTDLATTGEGGELLLFAMAEAIFGLAQIICKMSFKTATSVHYHGCDGVYAEVRKDGALNLYWGESKMHGDVSHAIRDCLDSLSPYLVDDSGEDAKRSQDIFLVNEFANFNNEKLVDALRQFLDTNNPASLSLHNCGIALTAFDCSAYPPEDVEAVADEIENAIKLELDSWSKAVAKRIIKNKLQRFDIHFICVPMPVVEKFREYFLTIMG